MVVGMEENMLVWFYGGMSVGCGSPRSIRRYRRLVAC